MFDRLGFELPLNYKRDRKFAPYKSIKVNALYNTKPVFSMEYGESGQNTLDKFLEAVKYRQLDDAMAYISKNYADRVDIDGISEAFDNENKLCQNYIIKTRFVEGPKNCIARTFMMVDKTQKKTRVFHIYMLNEPDNYGKWKIYNIEQE